MNEVAKNKKIVVMGATSGIGQEIAKMYIAMGCVVGVAGRRIDALQRLQSLAPGRVCIADIDITQNDAPDKLLRLIDACGGMELYFHSSGIGFNNPALDEKLESATAQTNACGFTRMMDAAFNYFTEHGGGHIAAITSIAGTKGLGAAPAYSATKRYQSAYLSALAQLASMRRRRITITDIRPGFVSTALLAKKRYPMVMDVKYAARKIFEAVERKRRVAIIDWRYALLVFFWKLIPQRIWERASVNVK